VFPLESPIIEFCIGALSNAQARGFESCKIFLLNFPKCFAALFDHCMVTRVSTPHAIHDVIFFSKIMLLLQVTDIRT